MNSIQSAFSIKVLDFFATSTTYQSKTHCQNNLGRNNLPSILLVTAVKLFLDWALRFAPRWLLARWLLVESEDLLLSPFIKWEWVTELLLGVITGGWGWPGIFTAGFFKATPFCCCCCCCCLSPTAGGDTRIFLAAWVSALDPRF